MHLHTYEITDNILCNYCYQLHFLRRVVLLDILHLNIQSHYISQQMIMLHDLMRKDSDRTSKILFFCQEEYDVKDSKLHSRLEKKQNLLNI